MNSTNTQIRTMVLTYEDAEQAHYTDAESDDGEIAEDITLVLEKSHWPVVFSVPGDVPSVITVTVAVEAY